LNIALKYLNKSKQSYTELGTQEEIKKCVDTFLIDCEAKGFTGSIEKYDVRAGSTWKLRNAGSVLKREKGNISKLVRYRHHIGTSKNIVCKFGEYGIYLTPM
jgi:hypothetical protein